MSAHPIVLFDGVCNLCHRSVQFIIRQDHQARFKFAPIQSSTGQRLMVDYALDPDDLSSFILIQNDKIYTKSDAWLKIVKTFPGVWSWLYAAIILPRALRDRFYDFIGSHRYQWFGKKESCMVPNADIRSRFLP